nr:POTRA domain-containing protein [Neisseria lactamica]
MAGIIAPATLLASPNPAEIRMQQDIQQRQREEQLRQTMQPESDVRLHQKNTGETVNQLMGDDSSQPCFAINEVVLEGEHHARFQFALKRALRETGFQAGKCLNAGDINHIMTVAQNILIGRGYTTTRILAAPQDLNSGKLVLTVLAGYLKNVEMDMSQANQTHAGRIAAFQNEFPTRSDGILNLRDLEQGLENLKRIPTVEADIQIVPVEGVPNQSTVLVK